MASKDPYSVLGVSPSAGDEEIKSAYRRLSKQYHPDLHPDDASAAAKMSEINAAYNQIKDAESRRRYTAESTYGSGNPFGSNPYGPFGGYQQSYGSYNTYSSGQSAGNDQEEWIYTPFGAFRVHRTTFYGDGQNTDGNTDGNRNGSAHDSHSSSGNYSSYGSYGGDGSHGGYGSYDSSRNQGGCSQGQGSYNSPYRRRGFSLLRLVIMFILISNLLTMCTRIVRYSTYNAYNSGGSSPYESSQPLDNSSGRNRQNF